MDTCIHMEEQPLEDLTYTVGEDSLEILGVQVLVQVLGH